MMLNVNKMLFPTDFSATTFRRAKEAVNLAQELKAEILFVHVITFHPMMATYAWPAMTYVELEQRIHEEAENNMVQFMRELEIPSTMKSSHKVLSGSVADSICEFVKTNKVDLIVIPTHQRKDVHKWFLGSITEKVVRLAPCHVLVLKNEEVRA